MAKFGVLNMTGESDEIIRANLIKAGMIDEDTELHILSRADLGLSEEASTEEMIEMVEAIMEAAEVFFGHSTHTFTRKRAQNSGE